MSAEQTPAPTSIPRHCGMEIVYGDSEGTYYAMPRDRESARKLSTIETNRAARRAIRGEEWCTSFCSLEHNLGETMSSALETQTLTFASTVEEAESIFDK